jgi:hypothetical protein
MGPHGKGFPIKVAPIREQHLAVKIARAMASGPRQITEGATVAEWNHDGTYSILRQGTSDWVCFPGNENEVGNVPMCCDPMGLQYAKDYMEGKHAPTNTSPGFIYMLCGATQHSNVDSFDKTSPLIPIGPHWMILWPYNSARDGPPRAVRDTGAWVLLIKRLMHICTFVVIHGKEMSMIQRLQERSGRCSMLLSGSKVCAALMENVGRGL